VSAPFTGTHHLLRLAVRRDRVRLSLWAAAITALTGASAAAVADFYDTPAKIAGYRATVVGSAASELMNGRPAGVSDIAGITAYETTMTALVAVALMCVFTVIRHTRGEEESGCAELLRATVTGRHAATLAAILVAGAAAVLVGALDVLVLLLNGLPRSGSLLHGASVAGVGLVFTALGSVAAQLTASSRAASGIALAFVGAAFLVRGLGDVLDTWLTWTSPFGWAQGVQPYGEPRTSLLVPLVVVTCLLFGLATYLTLHRDAGAGLLHARPGPDRARRRLSSAVGFAARLQRGSIVGWACGLLLGGLLMGSVGPEIEHLVESNPELASYFAGDTSQLLDAYFAQMTLIMAVVATGFSVSSALRPRSEENAGHAELVLATALSRTAWLGGFLAVTVLGSLVQLLAIGLGNAVGYGLAASDWSMTATLLTAALSLAPATLTVAASAVLLVGIRPRLALLTWGVLAFAFVQAYLGGLLEMPGWLAGLSPFDHLPLFPVQDLDTVRGTLVLAVGALSAATGVAFFRTRDV
jgi:ABC-2 type transport system permease protein